MALKPKKFSSTMSILTCHGLNSRGRLHFFGYIFTIFIHLLFNQSIFLTGHRLAQIFFSTQGRLWWLALNMAETISINFFFFNMSCIDATWMLPKGLIFFKIKEIIYLILKFKNGYIQADRAHIIQLFKWNCNRMEYALLDSWRDYVLN